MPIGVFINSLSILFGGLIGALIGNRVPERMKASLTSIFGISGMALGITIMVEVQNLAPVILSLIIGTAIGELLDVDGRLRAFTVLLKSKLKKGSSEMDERAIAGFITLLVLFCTSSTGIFGTLSEAITGDHTVLIVKAILDFFTSIIFASTIGYLVMLISIPQFALYILLYFLAAFIMPYLSDVMVADFKACGAIIAFAVGFRMLELKQIRVANVLPALIVVMPLSYLWTRIF